MNKHLITKEMERLEKKEASIYALEGVGLLKKVETLPNQEAKTEKIYLGEISDQYIKSLKLELEQEGYNVIIYHAN